jgi:pimeloyl-ACP methyl ester carboxylesterase
MATLAAGTAVVGAIGVAGWCVARAAVAAIERNPDPFSRAQLAREPEGEQVLIHRPDGTVIRAVVAGEGPTVVLANAYGIPLAEWNIVWDKLLARGHRVIAFDPRGHGRSTIGSAGIGSESMAADDAAVLEHFDVHEGVLVGHSTGGFIAIRALLDHPELAGRLRGLVLCATWAGRILDGAPQNWLQIPLLQTGILQQLMRTRTGRVLTGASMGGKHPSPAMIEVGYDMFRQQDHRSLLPILRACMREDRYPRLAEITVPTVVMVGSADRTTPPSHARRLAAGVPGARLVTVPDAGHILNWEAPDALVNAIGSFEKGPPLSAGG